MDALPISEAVGARTGGRRRSDPARQNLAPQWLVFAIVLVPALFMAAVGAQPWIDPADLLRDPIAVAELKGTQCCKIYYGAVSNLGVMIWTSGAAVCLFAAAVLAARPDGMRRAVFPFLAGVLTGVLALDDLFMLHDHALPHFGVPQPAVYATYAAMGLAYLLVCWRTILQSHYGLFVVAAGLLAASAGIDWLIHNDELWRLMVEDGAKWVGLCAWVGFHVVACWALLVDPAGHRN